jgi:uncharacterized membrane protein YgdD (TMEM256/DUF423 family)
MSDLIQKSASWLNKWIPALPSRSPVKVTEIERVVVREVDSMLTGHGRTFIRLAGLSGALAVAFGAYGAHVFRVGKSDEQLKHTYETGNRYHFLHTLALLGVPLTRKPLLVGSLMSVGMLLFSGSCYFHALTGSTAIRQVTPYGGMLLIAAWVAMIF